MSSLTLEFFHRADELKTLFTSSELLSLEFNLDFDGIKVSKKTGSLLVLTTTPALPSDFHKYWRNLNSKSVDKIHREGNLLKITSEAEALKVLKEGPVCIENHPNDLGRQNLHYQLKGAEIYSSLETKIVLEPTNSSLTNYYLLLTYLGKLYRNILPRLVREHCETQIDRYNKLYMYFDAKTSKEILRYL